MIWEPGAGSGSIVKVLATAGYTVAAVELRRECVETLRAAGAAQVFCPMDWLRLAPSLGGEVEAVVGNPPYAAALKFADACLNTGAAYVALLLPLSILASKKRYPWWRKHPPSWVGVVVKRPSFTGDGKTDSATYGWFVWRRGAPPLDLAWLPPENTEQLSIRLK